MKEVKKDISNFFRAALRGALSLLPSGAPEFIYTTILKPRPIRLAANGVLKMLLPQFVELPEGRLFLNQNDPVISGALSLGVYERFPTRVFREILCPGMIVVDIGANIGYYSVIAASRVGHGGKVIAYEPEPENFAMLEKNKEMNEFKNIACFCQAISSATGEIELFLVEGNKGKHSFVQDKSDQRSVKVRTNTLDESLASLGISKVDVIKIDIEGAEPEAFLGMEKTLRSCKPKILTEFYPDHIVQMGHDPVQFLTNIIRSGYAIFELNEKTGKLESIFNFQTFAHRIGRSSTNLLCEPK